MKLKKLLALFLCIGMIVCSLPLTASAAKVGDVIDWVLYTDITTYINGYFIPSYNINGYTAVVVEDLLYYGFDVVWDGTAKTLKVTRNFNKEFTPDYKPTANTHVVGSRAMPVLYTDIVTYFEGEQVTSYNVDGRTIAYVDDLATYYQKSYVWDNATRTLKLELKGAGAQSGPLTITRQPQDVTVSTNSGKAQFSIEVSGGTAPYTYQWQVAKNGSANFTNIPNSNTFSLNYSYSGASGTSLRCVVTDANGLVKTSSSAQILYAGSTAPLNAVISGGTAMASLNASIPLTCTATGGTGTYSYKWFRNDVAVASGIAYYNAQEAVAGQYRYYCEVTSGSSVVRTETVTITFGAEPSLELIATVGKAFSESVQFDTLGLFSTYYVNAERISDTLGDYGLALSLSTSGITVSGTPSKAGIAVASYRLIRFDGSYDVITLTVTVNAAASSGVTKSVTFDSSNDAIVGKNFSQTILFSNFGLQSSYASIICKSTNLPDFGISAERYSTYLTLAGKITKAGTGTAVYELKRSNGIVDTLNITVKASAATSGKDATYSLEFTVGTAKNVTLYYSSVSGLQSNYASYKFVQGLSNGLQTSTYTDRVEIWGTPTAAGSQTYKANLTRSDGTVDTLTVNVTVKAAASSGKNATYSLEFTVGTAKNVTLYYSSISGLQSNYASYKVTQGLSNGISSSTYTDRVEFWGTPTAAGSQTYKTNLTRSDGTVDTLTVTFTVKAAASAKTVTRSVEFEVGTYKNVTYYFSDLGLESSYSSVQVTKPLNSDYGVSSFTEKDHVTMRGTLNMTVSQTYTAKLTRSDGTVDTLIINANSKAAAGKNITRSFDFTVGKAESFTFYYGDNGLESNYSSAVATKTLTSSSGITTSTYKDRVEVWGTPAVVGTHTYKASLTRTNGTVDTLTINFIVKEATGISKTVTYDSSNGAKVGNNFSQSILFSNYGGLQSSYSMIYLKSSNLSDYGLSAKSSDGKTNLAFTGKITKAGTATATYELAREDGTKDTLIVVVKISN